MKTKSLLLLAGWLLATDINGAAEPAKPQEATPAYIVTLELLVDETGKVEEAKVVSSDEKQLNGIAMQVAKQMKLAPRQKDGVPIKYKVTAPLEFPVEGDGGPEAQKGPMPKITDWKKRMVPTFPYEMVKQTTGGGVILRLRINKDGSVVETKVVRASHQIYAEAAKGAISQWKFEQTIVDGQPVEMVRFQAVVFEPNGHKADWRWYVAPRPCLDTFTITGTWTPLR